jgi:hypothetical protein
MASDIAALTEVIRSLEAKVEEQQKLLKKLLRRNGVVATAEESSDEEKRGPGRPSKKNKRDHGPYPKGEIPEHLKAWHQLVNTTLEAMRAEGWRHPENGKEATRRDAITEASRRKKEGVAAPVAADAVPKAPVAADAVPKAPVAEAVPAPKPKKVRAKKTVAEA